MRRLALVLMTGLLGVTGTAGGAGSGVQGQPNDTKQRTQGRALFLEHCASCHGSSARGNGPVAPSLRQAPPDLTGYTRANGGVFPSERLRGVIDGRGVGAHGSVEMPVWGTAFKRTAAGPGEEAVRTRIGAILAFLESIQERAGD